MMIGTSFPSLRIFLQTSRPLVFGIMTSRMIRSGDSLAASVRAISPSAAWSTSNPS